MPSVIKDLRLKFAEWLMEKTLDLIPPGTNKDEFARSLRIYFRRSALALATRRRKRAESSQPRLDLGSSNSAALDSERSETSRG